MRRFILLLCAISLASCNVGAHGIGPYETSREAVRVCSTGTTLTGVDVSHYEGSVDWTQVAASGRTFAIAKATEGLSTRDAQFNANWSGIKQAGMVRAAYHFFHPADDGAMQADAFLAEVGTFGPGDLPPMLDWEVTDGVSNASNIQEAQKFIDEIMSRTGLQTVIYTYPGYWTSLGDPNQFANLPLWMANFGVSCPSIPSAWQTWAIWQDSETGSVPGISGQCDTDVFNGTLDQLHALAGNGMMPPPPMIDLIAQMSGNDWITAVNWPDHHVEIFTKTVSGEEVHSNTIGTGDTWSSATTLDTGVTCGSAASFWGASWQYPELFSPRTDHSTGHLWWAAGNWNAYHPYGGMSLSHLSTLVGQDGRTEVFALGADAAIWHNYWDTSVSNWSGWQSIGGSFMTGAGAIVWGDGTNALFATDRNGNVWTSTRPAMGSMTWSAWANLGGMIASRPTPVRWSDGHLQIFARGQDGQLYEASGTSPSQWTAFGVLSSGTQLVGDPSAIMGTGANAGPQVFSRDAHGIVVVLSWNGSFGNFAPIGGPTSTADPFGWTRGDGAAEVFSVDGTGQLLHSRFDATQGWTPWSSIMSGVDPCTLHTSSPDAGTAPDAQAPDASAGQEDAGALDGSSPSDASASAADASASGDASPYPRIRDGSTTATSTRVVKDGCSCSTESARGRAPWPPLALLAYLAAAAKRRRRIA
jgi:lysozyme